MNRLLIRKVHSLAQLLLPLLLLLLVVLFVGPIIGCALNGKAHALPSNQMVEWKISNQR